jgi:metal-responsive CopG/Arc/MetJ family transcriptional regulator
MGRRKKDSKMTSMNIDSTLYRNFKKQAIEDSISLTQLVEKAIRTYLSESCNNKALEQIGYEIQQAFTKM